MAVVSCACDVGVLCMYTDQSDSTFQCLIRQDENIFRRRVKKIDNHISLLLMRVNQAVAFPGILVFSI